MYAAIILSMLVFCFVCFIILCIEIIDNNGGNIHAERCNELNDTYGGDWYYDISSDSYLDYLTDRSVKRSEFRRPL